MATHAGTEQPITDDLIRPFAVEGVDVRGRIARLGPLVDDVLNRHSYPQPVSELLGQALTLTGLLGSALKFEGVFGLQTKGDGPISALIADYTAKGGAGVLRGYAAYDQTADFATVPTDFVSLVGKGYFAMTVDQGSEMERYQGIVELSGDSLAACAESYFRSSEQIPTAIQLSVGRFYQRPGNRAAPSETGGVWRAGGIMIQHLPPSRAALPPDAEMEESEHWRRSRMLMETVTNDELTDPTIAPERLLYRLFHEDGVRAFDPVPLRFGCRCSRERLARVLLKYPRETQEELVIDGRISANCEFCNETYHFTLDELGGQTPPNA